MSSELLAKRIVHNLVRMPASWGEAVSLQKEWLIGWLTWLNRDFSPVPVPLWLVDVALIILGTVVFTGLVILVLQGERLIPLYVVASVALICLTPWPKQFLRYLVPLLPLLAIALFVALGAAWEYLSMVTHGRRRFAGTALIVVVAFGIFGPRTIALYKFYTAEHRQQVSYEDEHGREQKSWRFLYTRAWRLHDAALDWLKGEAKPEEIVATSTPHWTYLTTGLRAVMLPFEPDVREAQRLVDSVPVSYLIIDSLDFVDISRRYAGPMVQAFPERWELIYSNPDSESQIYRRVTPRAGMGSP